MLQLIILRIAHSENRFRFRADALGLHRQQTFFSAVDDERA